MYSALSAKPHGSIRWFNMCLSFSFTHVFYQAKVNPDESSFHPKRQLFRETSDLSFSVDKYTACAFFFFFGQKVYKVKNKISTTSQ